MKKMYMYIGLAIISFLVLVVLCDFNVAAAAVLEVVLMFGTVSFALNAKPKQIRWSLLDPRLQGRDPSTFNLKEYTHYDAEMTEDLVKIYNPSGAENRLRRSQFRSL